MFISIKQYLRRNYDGLLFRPLRYKYNLWIQFDSNMPSMYKKVNNFRPNLRKYAMFEYFEYVLYIHTFHS